MTVHVVTLGELRVLRDGQELGALPGQKVRCGLLVYLAVERKVTRDHLMGILWPDRAPEKARHSLSQTLYELRKDLGEDWVQVQGETLSATDALTSDVAAFRQAAEAGLNAEAVEAYAGPFLAGANLGTSRDMEGWIDRVGSRLARAHRAAAAGLVRSREEAGDVEGALTVARSWADRDPLDDEAQHSLIDLLARSGRRAAALRHYDRYAALLARELDVEPLDQTRALVDEIRAGGGAAADGGARGGAEPPRTAPAGDSAREEAPGAGQAGHGDPPAAPTAGAASAGSGPAAPGPGHGVAPAAGAQRGAGGSTPAVPPSTGAPTTAPGGSGAHPPAGPEQGRRPSGEPETPLDALIAFADELRRRRVNRVAVAYVVVAFAFLEGADLLLVPLGAPAWVQTALAVLVVLGFPVLLVLAWVFDVTPQGLEVTRPVESGGAAVTAFARRGLIALVALSVMGLGAVWAWKMTVDAPVYDVNRVMVFPLEPPQGGTTLSASVGEDVATMIGHALDRTGPLRWIDGWTLLSPEERDDVSELTNAEALALAASRACRFFVNGRVVARGDEADVLLTLWDAAGDSSVALAQATGPAEQAWQTGLAAVTQLLPTIVGTDVPDFGQEVSSRNPVAVASFLLGEQAFRRVRPVVALAHYEAAVAEDSVFALAALRGAQAAGWTHDFGTARDLMAVAMAQDLAETDYHLAVGLRAQMDGLGDSARAALDRSLAADSANVLAWAAVGEVYAHTAPRTPRPDSMERAAFLRARDLEATGASTAFHLLEMALAEGALQASEPLMEAFLEVEPDPGLRTKMEFMDRCARSPMTVEDWLEAVAVDRRRVIQAGKQFALASRNPPCAEGAFRAVLRAEEGPTVGDREAALVGLQALLINQGRTDEALAVLDAASGSDATLRSFLSQTGGAGYAAAPGAFDARSSGGGVVSNRARSLALVFSGLGLDTGGRAEAAAAALRERWGPDYADAPPYNLGLWRLLIHEGARGDTVAMARVLAAMTDRAAAGHPTARQFEPVGQAHYALARGDTADALARFGALRTVGPRVWLEWTLPEPLGLERMTEARLLLARGTAGSARRAFDLASTLDGSSLGYTPYHAASLEVRIQAAEAMGRTDLADRLRRRLARVRDGLGVEPSPS